MDKTSFEDIAVVAMIARPVAAALLDVIVAAVTRLHRGHIVKVDVERGDGRSWGESMVSGSTTLIMALSSSSSRRNRRFCSVNDPNHLFKYSHSISVCFSLLLQCYLAQFLFPQKIIASWGSSLSKLILSQFMHNSINFPR